MQTTLPPAGTKFVSRKNILNVHELEWAIADKKSNMILTEYKSTQKKAKAQYVNMFGSSHIPTGDR